MKRTTEKVLAIISAVFTVAFTILGFIGLGFMKMVTSDPAIRADFEKELLDFDSTITPTDVASIFDSLSVFEGISWFLIILLIISLVTTIIGLVFIWNNKNAKLAGIMFIISGLFAFVLTPTSILLYIAGILCFTKKAPLVAESVYSNEQKDDSMRPL